MMDNVIMPFGKYAGRKIKDIPLSYIEWLIKNESVSKNKWKEVYDYYISLLKDDSVCERCCLTDVWVKIGFINFDKCYFLCEDCFIELEINDEMS